MKLQFFAIPAISPGPAQEEFNRFVASHRIARVEKELITDGAASFWSVCVTWVEGEPGAGPMSPPLRRGKEVDYRETLPPAEFAVFDRLRPDVVAFLDAVPQRLAAVRLALLDACLPDGRLRKFAIRDPKPRLIHAAPFADRVAHHALMRLLEPRLEKALVPTSYACRPGRGLPIGSLTSQRFANQYLGELDRHAIAQPECRAHLRYMDDVVLWCDSGEAARALRDRLMAWLPETLGLDFKPPTVQRSERGLSLCGMRVWPSGLRLGARRQRAWRRVAREIDDAQAAGADERWLQQRAEVLRGLSLPTRRRGWQRAVLLRCPSAALPQEESESPAGASRRELDQQRQELPLRQPQRERAG